MRGYVTAEEARTARNHEPLARFLNAKDALKAAETEMVEARAQLRIAVKVGSDLLTSMAAGQGEQP